MPFAADIKTRICLALGLPITAPRFVETVDRALLDAEAYGGQAAVTLITSYVTQYEAAQTALNSDAANNGLIRADVLEWAAGGKSRGYQSEMLRLRQQLAKTLLLEGLMRHSGPNRVSINRG